VSREDDFFALGGHSLLATQAISRLRDACGIDLPVDAMFEHPRVHQLASRIATLLAQDARTSTPPMTRVSRQNPVPTSYAQQRLWFLDQWLPDRPTFNVAAAMTMAGPLDIPALRHSLLDLVRRHEVLRTTVRTSEAGLCQHIAPDPHPGAQLAVVDLTGCDQSTRRSATVEIVNRWAWHPFALAEGPLFRVALLRLDAREHVLVIAMHHMVSDGWSTMILSRELTALYESRRTGGSGQALPELPLQYADYAVWQRRVVESGAAQSSLEYWREQLRGATDVVLPSDRPVVAMARGRGMRERLTLSSGLREQIQDLRVEGTPFMVLLAAFVALLHRYTGCEDLAISSAAAGRTRSELESMVGLVANAAVFRIRFAADWTFTRLLREVRRVALGVYTHQDYPFDRLIAELGSSRTATRQPFSQLAFFYQTAEGRSFALPGLVVTPIEPTRRTAVYDLMLSVTDDGTSAQAALEYNSDLFSGESARSLLLNYRATLAASLADPNQSLDDLSLDTAVTAAAGPLV
jgi:hypothetical protein